jgi:hypothetical protein
MWKNVEKSVPLLTTPKKPSKKRKILTVWVCFVKSMELECGKLCYVRV